MFARILVVAGKDNNSPGSDSTLAERARFIADRTGAETRWTALSGSDLLNEVDAYRPDLVLKEASDRSGLTGFFAQGDWDLLHATDVPFWFTRQGNPPVRRLLAALDWVVEEEGRQATDLLVAEKSIALRDLLSAELSFVHAYDIPEPPTRFLVTTPFPEGIGTADMIDELVAGERTALLDTEHEHRQKLEAFAQFVGFDPEGIVLARGRPSSVLTRVADSTSAGLIIMGTLDKSAWERFWQGASELETLAESPCDVLIFNAAGLSTQAGG